MCFDRPRSLWFALLLACGCAGSSRAAATAEAPADGAEGNETAETSETEQPEPPAKAEGTTSKAATPQAKTEAATPAEGATSQRPAEPPHHPPEVTRAALDNTAQAVDARGRLGLRLAVVERGPDTPWVYAIVNRGTEPVRVRPDLRTLSLEVTLPTPPPDPKRRKVTAPKPVRCALPKEQIPRDEESSPDVLLAPGEGIVDSFDPRLYCLSLGEKALVPEATVVARLGWSEKTKKVWSKGKAQTLVLEQVPPFVAQRELSASALPEPAKNQLKREPGTPPLSDEVATKELVSQPIQLGAEYKKDESPPEPGPLKLEISRNADAATERDALLTATLSNIAKKPQRVLFRRELISFEISGPDGLVTCAPGPDDRFPDRTSIVSLRPGGRLRATSRLIELCPVGALRRPGLYLIHARFDSQLRGEAAQGVFDGRLLSHKPAVVRIRRGWGTLPKERQPERIRIGAP